MRFEEKDENKGSKGIGNEGMKEKIKEEIKKLLKIKEMRTNLKSKNKVEEGEEGNEKVY